MKLPAAKLVKTIRCNNTGVQEYQKCSFFIWTFSWAYDTENEDGVPKFLSVICETVRFKKIKVSQSAKHNLGGSSAEKISLTSSFSLLF